jgi:hypothetical protein
MTTAATSRTTTPTARPITSFAIVFMEKNPSAGWECRGV